MLNDSPKCRDGAMWKVQNLEQFNAKTQRREEKNQSADYSGDSRNNPLTTGFISVTSVVKKWIYFVLFVVKVFKMIWGCGCAAFFCNYLDRIQNRS